MFTFHRWLWTQHTRCRRWSLPCGRWAVFFQPDYVFYFFVILGHRDACICVTHESLTSLLLFFFPQVGCKAIVCPTQFKTLNYCNMLRKICPEIETCSPGDIKSSRYRSPVSPSDRKVMFLQPSKLEGCRFNGLKIIVTWTLAMRLICILGRTKDELFKFNCGETWWLEAFITEGFTLKLVQKHTCFICW